MRNDTFRAVLARKYLAVIYFVLLHSGCVSVYEAVSI